jgi:molybdate transport system substrate-binding protein
LASGHRSRDGWRAENARAALFVVSRQEAPFGIVYETDAAADKGVMIVAALPENTHPPIVYPIALTGSAGFLRLLESPAAKPIFEQQGFEVPP